LDSSSGTVDDVDAAGPGLTAQQHQEQARAQFPLQAETITIVDDTIMGSERSHLKHACRGAPVSKRARPQESESMSSLMRTMADEAAAMEKEMNEATEQLEPMNSWDDDEL